MLGEDRRRLLLDTLNRRGSLSVAAAQAALRVSRMTIHRDLEALAGQGLLRKVHGGALSLEEARGAREWWPSPFEERQAAAGSAKKAIGRHLAGLVQGSQSLLLDASSTVFSLAGSWRRRRSGGPLFIATGGLPLFGELLTLGGGVRAALHGGEPHPRTGTLVGPLAVASLAGMRFDWAIVSAFGLMEEEGLAYEATPEEAELKRAYLARARRKALAMDATKLNRSAPYSLAPLEAFDALVTEEGVVALPGRRGGRQAAGGTGAAGSSRRNRR